MSLTKPSREEYTGDWLCVGCAALSPNRMRTCTCPTNVVVRSLSGKESAWKINATDVDIARASERLDYFSAGRHEGTAPNPRDFDELLAHALKLRDRLRSEGILP